MFFYFGETNKSRLLYNIPLGLFGSLAVNHICEERDLSYAFFFLSNALFYLLISIGNII